LAKKCLFILLVGYSMHVPVFSLGRLLSAPAGVREGAFQVDILQVIAVSLLGLLGIAVLARTRRGRIICVGTAGMLILLAGALAGGTSVLDGLGGSLPVWLRAYFSPEVSPLFTMVPWAVHLLAGFLAGDLYVRGMTAGEEGRTVGRIALSAAAALVPATAISMVTIREYAGDAFWYWSAEYVVIRLASVVLGMCALWYLTRGGAGPIMSAAGLFGRESLPVYYLHLLIVYGKDFDWSFVRIFPDGMGYPGCFGLAAALTGAMYLFARGWGSAKKNYPRASALAVRGLVAGSVLTFLLS
ncbi:MAG TPA: hypothetical protein VJO14_04145, partial [Bacteroidota bacterium]|nr:hypothetical protein [Bacteroidota bacterium]